MGRNCTTRFRDQILPMASRPTVQLSNVNTKLSSHNHKLKCVIRFLCLPESSTSSLTNCCHQHYLDANVRMAFLWWVCSSRGTALKHCWSSEESSGCGSVNKLTVSSDVFKMQLHSRVCSLCTPAFRWEKCVLDNKGLQSLDLLVITSSFNQQSWKEGLTYMA